MIWFPTVQQIIKLHDKVTERTGGYRGVRDLGLIESAIMRAQAQYGGVEAYNTIAEKASAVCCGLIGNHGFVDGNKRIGIMTMLLILRKNGIALRYTQAELICMGLDIAQGNIDVHGVAAWIEAHINKATEK